MLEELSEGMGSDTGVTTSSDAFLAQQVAEYERCQQRHRERQPGGAETALAGSHSCPQDPPVPQGHGKARRLAAALAMFAGAPTLEEAVEALVAPAAVPSSAAPAPATPGGHGAGGRAAWPQLSSRSSSSSAIGTEMELASLGSGSSGACCVAGSARPFCAGGSAGWPEIDLAPSSGCAGSSSAGLDGRAGPGGSRDRAAAWLHSQAGPCGSGYEEWHSAGPSSSLPARYA